MISKIKLLSLLVLFIFQLLPAQKKTDSKAVTDTLTDLQTPILVNKIENYKLLINRNSFLLKKNYDLKSIKKEFPPLEKGISGFKNKFDSLRNNMNIRTLNSSIILLNEAIEKLDAYELELTEYQKKLNASNAQINKILVDKDLNVSINDAVLKGQVDELISEAKNLKYQQNKILSSVNLWSSKVSINNYQTQDLISDMTYMGIAKKMDMFSAEESGLFTLKAGSYKNSLYSAVVKALTTSFKIVTIYLKSRTGIILFNFFIFIGLSIWLAYNLRRIKNQDDSVAILSLSNIIGRSIWLSSIFCFLTYMPLSFGNPPMSFLHLCEFVRIIVLYFLIAPFINQPFKLIWTGIVILWTGYAIDDLLLESAYGERWALLLMGLMMVVICGYLLKSREKYFKILEESPVAKALLIFVLFQFLLSILCNITGHLTLAKTFGITAVQCLVYGVALKIFCRIVIEAIYLQTETFQSSRISEYINFKEIQHRIQRNLWILACLAFFVAFVRSLGYYDLLMKISTSFLYEQRAIGSYKFTLASVFIFFIILWISSIISGFINFFFGYNKTVAGGKRNGLNSMMLLVRLAIYSVGFLIAIAAAGIPLDRVSIMLGALGVGIGFGLQNIINNLVSGVIIAFERPIQIGDQIEIGTKAGFVKEIGIRSSKIHSADGADIIVPNGDLLSQHLINWTMQDRRKRIEFIIGVPYDSDLDIARSVIAEELSTNQNISTISSPTINVNDFGENSVRLKIHIWVDDLSLALEARTTAMIGTQKALARVGILMTTAI